MPYQRAGDQPTDPEAETSSLDADELEISVFRPDREGIRKVLGDLEADIMEYIWQATSITEKGVTVRDVYEAFRLQRIIAYTTVMSTMTRLSKKHLLRVRKEDTAYVYSPRFSKDALIEKVVSSILENLLVSFSHTTQAQVQRLVTPEGSERLATLRAKVDNLRASHPNLQAASDQPGSETSADGGH